jgi:hypothetical protein
MVPQTLNLKVWCKVSGTMDPGTSVTEGEPSSG